MLVDTGGVLTVPKSDSFADGIAITTSGGESALSRAVQEAKQAGLPAMIEKQAALALEDAQAIIFVVDGQV
jgi:GTP-binding protein